MAEGIIVGGWNYVIAAYGITVVGLSLYVWTLVSRTRDSHRDRS